MFKQLAGGLDILPVPYKGMGPAQMDVVNGTVSMFVPNITGAVIGLHAGGKIRIVAVNAPARHPGMPDIPTAIEAGLPGMITQNFFGIFAPAGTPKAVLERVNEATQQALADKEFRERLAKAAFDPVPGLGPEKSRAYVTDEFARWRRRSWKRPGSVTDAPAASVQASTELSASAPAPPAAAAPRCW